jgi:glutathione S-transferase
MTYTLYGAPLSLYTGKARSYLRRQDIDFREESPGGDRYLKHVMPTVGRFIVPCMETPDGEIIQDGADIIDHFEQGPGRALRTFDVYPRSPLLLAISHLFELFGGEGLLRPAMHYRWNFDEENLSFLRAEVPVLGPPAITPEVAEQYFQTANRRMRKAASSFGVTPESAALIEESFGEWLDLFSAHLVEHPYLLGGQPTIGDFGLIASMWAHLYRDPAPTRVIKSRAPRVGRWVERMTTSEPYVHEYVTDGSLIDDTAIPDTLLAMMRFVSEEYLPEIVAHVEQANAWLDRHPDIEAGTNGVDDPAYRGLARGADGQATFAWRGIELTTGVMPYRFWLMQRLHDDLAGAPAGEQARTREVFAATGLEPILDLRTLRRVERHGHLEVWGPLV